MRKGTKFVLMAIAGLWAFAMLMTLPMLTTATRERGAAENLLREYLTAVLAGDYQKAYQYCGQEFRSATPLAAFVEQHEQVTRRQGSLRAFTVGQSEVSIKADEEEWFARFEVGLDLEFKAASSLFELRREKGRWVVFGYRLQI